MQIRKGKVEELEIIYSIYEHARGFMADHQNPTQWGDNYPPIELIKQDLENGISYVCEDNEKICAVFALIEGPDPTYKDIYEGKWINDLPYVVVHRLASSGTVKGAGESCLKYVVNNYGEVRIDTHKDNYPMQNLIIKLGFTYCGIIYTHDGTARLAYQYTK